MLGNALRHLYPAFFKRFDRWLLLRAPLLWRTRVAQSMLVLGFLTLAMMLLSLLPGFSDAPPSGDSILASWRFRVNLVVIALAVWLTVILRKPVGELLPRRHISTVVAVTVGAYLWLAAPSFLACLDIAAIAGVKIENTQLQSDRAFLARHDNWGCIPSSVWRSPESKAELGQQLHDLRAHYYDLHGEGPSFETAPSEPWRKCVPDSHRLEKPGTYSIEQRIKEILDARSFWSGKSDRNQFSPIRSTLEWFGVLAFAIGVLIALLSYPLYVWRRSFSQS